MTDTDTSLPVAPEALWALECARRASLAALGITPLVSRTDPAGARPAARYAAPQQVESQMSAAAAPRKVEAQGAQVRAMLEGPSEVPRAEAQKAQSEAVHPSTDTPTGSQAAPDKQPPLSLVMVTSGDVLWVEVLEDQLLRQEQLQLIAAMARAIRGASVRCGHQQFDWPPAQQSALAKAPGGLGDMLSGFLQRLTTDHRTQLIICMGPCESLPDTGLPVHHIPSSLEMLRDSALKQTAWATLRPLCHSD
ncbi:MAG: hypothetical protein CME58_11995 [Halieaceae bacterium]|nr:hypothetical protein [Halieaceae bacterium]|tara:strand:- start:347 stop:1096 length:750 start_codon:yes stop_codon:yes gene_type:complete